MLTQEADWSELPSFAHIQRQLEGPIQEKHYGEVINWDRLEHSLDAKVVADIQEHLPSRLALTELNAKTVFTPLHDHLKRLRNREEVLLGTEIAAHSISEHPVRIAYHGTNLLDYLVLASSWSFKPSELYPILEEVDIENALTFFMTSELAVDEYDTNVAQYALRPSLLLKLVEDKLDESFDQARSIMQLGQLGVVLAIQLKGYEIFTNPGQIPLLSWDGSVYEALTPPPTTYIKPVAVVCDDAGLPPPY